MIKVNWDVEELVALIDVYRRSDEKSAEQIEVELLALSKAFVEENINDKPFLFLPEIYEAESSIAQRIKVMIEYPPTPKEISPAEIDTFEKANDIVFDEKQRQAIEIAVNKGLLILTGGPGTG